MSVKVNSKEELVDAIKNDEATIEICDPSTGNTIIRIKGVGAVAWVVAIGGIGIAVASILVPSPDPATKGVIPLAGVGGSIAILGASATTGAIALAVAAGSTKILTKIRGYNIQKLPNGHVLLTK
jgi:hypothetical protein